MTEKTANPYSVKVAALYHFCRISALDDLAEQLREFCRAHGIRGTLILAQEGINGTVAGAPGAIDSLMDYLKSQPEFQQIEVKFSGAETMPFNRMKVRLKREIVTLGVDGIDPVADVGTYVQPDDWNALISDPDTVVVDTRNIYEIDIGSFKGALSPETETFRAFPDWVARNREQLEGRKVAMFCTGGIRCEKATAFMKSVGIDDVYHLKGGILKYLEEVPVESSLWEGECFVFDERVSVKHGLEIGEASLCRACREPLTEKDRQSASFVEGISCPRCIDRRTDRDRERYAERQRQVELARRRGDAAHIGN